MAVLKLEFKIQLDSDQPLEYDTILQMLKDHVHISLTGPLQDKISLLDLNTLQFSEQEEAPPDCNFYPADCLDDPEEEEEEEEYYEDEQYDEDEDGDEQYEEEYLREEFLEGDEVMVEFEGINYFGDFVAYKDNHTKAMIRFEDGTANFPIENVKHRDEWDI